MIRNGIEPLYKDFQSNALPLSYPTLIGFFSVNFWEVGIELTFSVPKTNVLPFILFPIILKVQCIA